MGGSYNLLQLPVDVTYRIDAVKFTDVPILKVFVRIPQTDGTVEALNYEAVQTSEADATQIYFYVGRGNTDKTIRRVTSDALKTQDMMESTEDTYNPDYNESLQTNLGSPENFTAIYGNGSVQLHWNNPAHPNLAGVRIMRSSGTYPGAPENGTLVYEGSGTSFLDNDISQGLAYYYQAWSYDASRVYSDPASAMINTKVYSVFGKISLAAGAGLGGATATLTDSAGQFVGSAQSGPDGAYAITNLEMDGYTLTASHPSHEITNPVRSISLTQNAEENFTATPVPTLNLLFDTPTVSINSMVSVPWAYRNIDNSSTLNIQLNRAGQWETIATNIPVLNGQIQWTATGGDNEQVVLRISLSSNASVYAEKTFVLSSAALPGDVNGDSIVDLKDAVIALQILTGILPEGSVNLAADVDGNGRIGMAEAIYAMQKAAGL